MTTPLATTIDPPPRHELLRRLRRVRRVGAIVAVVAGLSQATLAILGAVLLAISLDWLLRLPGLLRLAELLSLVVLVAATLNRHVIARLRLPPLSHIARQIQHTIAGPPDCLASGVEFAATSQSNPLAARTVARSADLARQLSPMRLARLRWMAAWLAGAVLAISALLVSQPVIGPWIECGLTRLAWPVLWTDWPRRTQILSDQSAKSLLAAVGEPVILQARIARGGSGASAWLVLQEATRARRFEMTDTGDGNRTITVRLPGSAAFWFQAGDDDTRAQAGTIRVVPRPAVTAAEILVQPPAYTAQPPGRITLGSGPIQVPEGSRVDLDIAVSKPLADDAGRPRATITLAPADAPDAQPVETLDVRFGSDHQRISAGWWCSRDSLVRADFTDTDSFACVPLQPWRIGARIDQPPAAQVFSPPDAIEVAPGAVVPVQATVTDDYGIDDLRLAWRISRAGEAASQPAEPTDQLQRIPTTQPQRSGDAVSLPVDWAWSLSPLSLQPGDRLTWSLQVQDNYDLSGRRHPPVRTSPRTIRIVSESDLLESVLQGLAESRNRILQMRQQQRDLHETLLAADTQPAGDPTSLHAGMERQSQILSHARTLASELARTADRLRTNRLQREDLADSVSRASRQLSQIQSREMADVQRHLQGAQSNPSDPSTRSAAQSADAAAKALETLLQDTAGWTSLESAALGLQDLIDRQKALQADTSDLASKTLGEPVDQLPGVSRESLRKLAENQRSLSQRVEQLQKDMKAQASDGTSDQKQKMETAADILNQRNTAADMAASADEIARNVTTIAQQRQQAARQALQQALDALRGRKPDQQDTADLAGPTAPLARQLKDLAQKQTNLRAQTGDINARRDPAGSLDRAGLLRLNQAGKGQADLARQVQQAQPTATGQAAQRLLDAVAGQMQTAARDMQAGASGQPVLDSQQHAAEILSALADAVERASRQQPGQQSSQAGAQGKSGSSGTSADKSSEIEVLYLLQQDLLFRTQHASRTGAEGPTIQQLGQEQQQVRDLAERVLSEQ